MRGKRYGPLLMCGLLCALLLSGCSGMMQSLADGTDAVLNGLAEGTDRVTGYLADLTDNAMEAAAGATDDSVKDAILDAYDSLVDTAGVVVLARNTLPLKGTVRRQRPGADYEDFSGTELLFGGTTLDREAGNTVEVTSSLIIEEGEGRRLPTFRRGGTGDPAVRERGLLRHR